LAVKNIISISSDYNIDENLAITNRSESLPSTRKAFDP